MLERARARWTEPRASVPAFAVGALTVAMAVLTLHLGTAHAMEASHGHVATAGGDTFQELMNGAMDRMHAGMAVSPGGDPDVDFARMMIPHHQGAVDMAVVELRFGRDERLRRLAQAIIIEQKQEIDVMQAVLRDLSPAPDQTAQGSR